MFYTCDNAECATIQDKLTITVYSREPANNLNQVEEFELNGVNKGLKWEQMRIYFGTEFEQIYVRNI